jgi:hypothetical protein
MGGFYTCKSFPPRHGHKDASEDTAQRETSGSNGYEDSRSVMGDAAEPSLDAIDPVTHSDPPTVDDHVRLVA